MRDGLGKYHNARILLDSTSDVNFMTTSLVKRLKLKQFEVWKTIKTVNQVAVNYDKATTTEVKSRFNNFSATVNFLIACNDFLPETPAKTLSLEYARIPKDAILADEMFHLPQGIDALVGKDLFFDVLGSKTYESDGISLRETLFGCIVTKILQNKPPSLEAISASACAEDMDEIVRRFWEIESVEDNIKPARSIEELECEKLFQESTSRTMEGRFIVQLPWNDNSSKLGASRGQAIRRFLTMERKLSQNNWLRENYDQFMSEYINLGHMVEINDNEEDGFYIPHHGVVKESSLTTKLRVVFDASAKTDNGLSLNDLLKTGPQLQQDLFSILTRFRSHRYVLTADITKMYRQILLHDKEKPFHKIVWRAKREDALKTYALQTLTYGTTPASFLAIRCLQELAREYGKERSCAARIILEDFYVDDLLTGADTVEEVTCIQRQLTNILSSGGMQLRKWNSNSKEILSKIPINEASDSFILDWDKSENVKTLGITWNSKTDLIEYKVCTGKIINFTKRNILSAIAQIFDPLGLVGPIIVSAKILMQEIWKLKLDWDEELPKGLQQKWVAFSEGLARITCRIPRFIETHMEATIELHGFSDASQLAYGAAIYVRTTCKENISSSLLCSKSRVAPLKTISLPRLELCGALLLAQLMQKVQSILGKTVSARYYYTDSTITLAWIQAPASKWKTFVANRVGEIQQLSKPDEWNHVKTSENPADLISRGVKPLELPTTRLWWKGPDWLADKAKYVTKTIHHTNLEEKESDSMSLSCLEPLNLISRFSSLEKLIRITALCLRFVNNLRTTNKTYGKVQQEERKEAQRRLISLTQREVYQKDLEYLRKNKTVHPKSQIKCLSPFIDVNDGLLRVGGRLKHSKLAYEEKCPLLLPTNHCFTKLIIKNEHLRTLHGGTEATIVALRQQFWIPAARKVVRGVIRQCLVCFRTQPTPSQQIMGELPAARVCLPKRPFETTGVDFCGPFNIKEGSRRSKRMVKIYVAIFVCFATKALHLEMVTNLTAEAFIAALKRFVSRRGLVSEIHSDNATNFGGADKELQKLLTLFQEDNKDGDKLSEYLSTNGIKWRFIPPRSPHFGGLWEAAVKSFKRQFKRIATESNLTFEEFQTFAVQIEAALNSRPLCPLSNDPNDFEALTPGHFLIGGALNCIPEPSLETIPTNQLSRWQHIQQMREHFWRRWISEYLKEQQKRTKWRTCKNPIQINQLVLIHEDNIPPQIWKMGRIQAIHPGTDGVVRTATIAIPSAKDKPKLIKRAISRLYVLPIEENIQSC